MTKVVVRWLLLYGIPAIFFIGLDFSSNRITWSGMMACIWVVLLSGWVEASNIEQQSQIEKLKIQIGQLSKMQHSSETGICQK